MTTKLCTAWLLGIVVATFAGLVVDGFSSSIILPSTKGPRRIIPLKSLSISPFDIRQLLSTSLAMSSSSSFMVRDFSLIEELEQIVELASRAIPERPDGIVTVAKYTSKFRPECQATENDYDRIARDNPATIFLRCFEEYDNAHLLIGQVDINIWPTYDIFYGGNRVARVEGSDLATFEKTLQQFQFINSDLDLFSEDANQQQKRQLQWGDGQRKDMTKTPRTTARFVPGYDWNKNGGGILDDVTGKAQQSFEDTFGNWLPPDMDDDEENK